MRILFLPLLICGTAAFWAPPPAVGSARGAGVRMKTPEGMTITSNFYSKSLVIWDCDGVLVDSEALLKTAEVEALAAAGFPDVTEDDCNRLFSGFAP